MKNIVRIIVALLIISLILPACHVAGESGGAGTGELRGVWVSSVVNIDYPSKPSTDPEALKTEALKILDDAASLGMNAIFLQVRPTSDALYKSNIFPWSKYLTGKQGLMPNDGFDPLEFWVTESHKRGMQLHAWVNPYRVTKKGSGEPNHDFSSLDPSNPAAQHPEWVVKYGDGNLYYDPGIPEVRKLVIDGALEMIQNYAVDGIHFDDYFYPGKDFDDKASFEKYGAGFDNVNDWRRENVNILIRDLSKAIKATSKDVSFGISPFGIWANKNSNALGSDTKGLQSYYDQYADTRKWVKEGMLDYIAPQIYWNIGYSIADYSKILSWWKDVVAGTGVKLYIGQAAYKSGNADPANVWYGVAEMERQLKLNTTIPEVKGSIFFSHRSFTNNPALGAVVKTYYQQKDGMRASIPVNAAKPSGNLRTSLTQYYVTGSSDPSKPLYLNGKEVTGRSSQGFFGLLVKLNKGANVLTFSQDGSYTTRAIYRDVASTAPVKMAKAEIPVASTFPQSQEYRTSGEQLTLTCKAPIGAKVTVEIGGKTFDMKPAAATAPDANIYATTYTCVYTVPSYTEVNKNIDLGTPVYTMNYNGTVATTKAPAAVGVILKGSPNYAMITADVASLYTAATTSNGVAYELYKGMVDNITGMTGGYIRLSSGNWIDKSNVKLFAADWISANAYSAEYTTGQSWDTLSLGLSDPTAAIASFDGSSLKINLSMAVSGAVPNLPADSLFSGASVVKTNNGIQYVLTIKSGQSIEGYYVELVPTGLNVKIKRPVKAVQGEKPLTGITIMVDGGHGGTDSGAIGPQGVINSEKVINLGNALKLRDQLQSLGATVLMTRTSDVTISLPDRLAASRKAKPDMFISIHANSMGDNVDISNVAGFSAFYREQFVQPLCSTVFNNVLTALKREDKGMRKNNLYVNTATWTPSILIESGFVPNPNEFEWLIDQNQQTTLAKTVADAIVKYFSR
jgi:uncharacterized lipoprotein YddW (UPF0748 family)/N-acetylmuramoyl-L-alanine amidase